MTLPPETQRAVERFVSLTADLPNDYRLDSAWSPCGDDDAPIAVLTLGDLRTILTALSEASAREGVLEGALEPFARAAIHAECQTGTNETSGSTALCRAARGETAWADYVRARTALSRTTPIEEA